MASIIGLLNRFLPFATPGTPLLQDLVHLGAICTLLYYAPQIQHWVQEQQNPTGAQDETQNDNTVHLDNAPRAPQDENPRQPAFADDNADQHAAPDDFENVPNDNFEAEQAHADIEEGQPGPAGPANAPPHRNVGAKKAKSLARKDQRRAYNEFMRSQGDAQRAEDAKDAAEREATLAVERERRKAAAAALEAKKAKERERKREAERKQREEEIRCRELAISLVREALEDQRMCDLFKVARQVGGDVDEEWVERIIRSAYTALEILLQTLKPVVAKVVMPDRKLHGVIHGNDVVRGLAVKSPRNSSLVPAMTAVTGRCPARGTEPPSRRG